MFDESRDAGPTTKPIARMLARVRIEALYVHPVKSCAGIRLPSAQLDARGIRWDRRWMVVDADGRFITQREEPRLALAKTCLGRDGLRLESPGIGSVDVPYKPAAGSERVTVRVWDDDCEAVRIGGAAREWLSALLGIEASLVFMPDETVRPVDSAYASAGSRVGFADAFPLLIVGRASFDDLAARVAEPLVIERFRPNLVVEGSAPYAEDGWQRIRAGEIEIDLVKPCSRCAITTVDPATGATGHEPLRTLATYRKVGSKVMFGMNAIHAAPGALAEGDPIEVVR